MNTKIIECNDRGIKLDEFKTVTKELIINNNIYYNGKHYIPKAIIRHKSVKRKKSGHKITTEIEQVAICEVI